MNNLQESLKHLESRSRSLEPDEQTRHRIFDDVESYVHQFINSLPDRLAYIKADCPQLKNLAVTSTGKPLDALMQIIDQEVHHAGINAASGGHMGYIPGGGLWMSSIGDMLADVGNRYAGISFSGTGAVIMENLLLRWLADLIGYPATAHGNITSGGSIATLIALTTARDLNEIHATAVYQAVIYATAEAHHCIHKALHILGLQKAIFREVPMNDRFEMKVEDLKALIRQDRTSGLNPFLVIANAGTTNTGSIDPLDLIADVCADEKLWYHVDAAYGGFFMLVDSLKSKFKGIERSDSVVLDPHKGMFLPFGTGVVLVRDAKKLLTAHHADASYLIDTVGYDEINPSDCGPELTKHFRGLRMWLPLHYHGLDAFRACLEEKLLLCQYFHQEVQKLGFETGPEPELSVTYFRYPAPDKNEFNRHLVERLHRDGRVFLSSTILNGEVWIRCAILSFRTHLREVQIALEMIRENLS
ncbi:MAG TPA: aminotransferase class V-fold PLP-dependent enzyme [Saprospiraceae bacterium]|nr:aminotransferase class V-fold PLP-dependent enzyme [Saprospiraceae bacterium]